MTGDTTNAHWSDYWRTGNVASVLLEQNYDGETREFWLQQFAGLPHDAAILDVCAGNGAIALLAQAYSDEHGRAFRVQATDAAAIDPQRIASRNPDLTDQVARIGFMGGIPLEQLEATPASFSLLSSQYGIEYTDTTRTAGVIARLLRPGGHFVMVSHARGSILMQTKDRLLWDFGLVETAGVFALDEALRSGQLPIDRFPSELNAVLNALFHAGRDHKANVVPDIGRTLEPLCRAVGTGLGAAADQFAALCRECRFQRQRQLDLQAVDERFAADPDWHRSFESAGLSLLDAGPMLQMQKSLLVGEYRRYVRAA